MNFEVLITGIIGLITTIVTNVLTFVFSRRKYNAGVDHDTIDNMKNALQFYENAIESNNRTLTDVLSKSENLAKVNAQLLLEVQNLKIQVEILTQIIKTELKDIDLGKYGIEKDDKGSIKLNSPSVDKQNKSSNKQLKKE